MSALTDNQLATVNAYLDKQRQSHGLPLITGKIAATAKEAVRALSEADAVDESSALAFDPREVEDALRYHRSGIQRFVAEGCDWLPASAWLAASEHVGGAANDPYGYPTGHLAQTALEWLRRLRVVKAEPHVGVLLHPTMINGLRSVSG